jgi:hypothetical protein
VVLKKTSITKRRERHTCTGEVMGSDRHARKLYQIGIDFGATLGGSNDGHDRSEGLEMQSERTENKDKDKPDHAHDTTIVVNAQEKTVAAKEITFEQLVDLAYDGNPPQGENWVFTLTYRRGADESPQGSLVKGASVKVKKGMVFNVTATDKA